MTTLNATKRKCNVLASGPIMELGGVTGPVYGCQLTNEQIIRMVNNGRKVEEVDPKNFARKELLTIATCQKSVFGTTNAEKVSAPTKEPVHETVQREQTLNNMSKKERKRREWEARQQAKVDTVEAVIKVGEAIDKECGVVRNQNSDISEMGAPLKEEGENK